MKDVTILLFYALMFWMLIEQNVGFLEYIIFLTKFVKTNFNLFLLFHLSTGKIFLKDQSVALVSHC